MDEMKRGGAGVRDRRVHRRGRRHRGRRSTRPLISSGIVDSFSMVSLKAFLEKKYDIKLPDAEATPEAFDTVNSIVTLVAGSSGQLSMRGPTRFRSSDAMAYSTADASGVRRRDRRDQATKGLYKEKRFICSPQGAEIEVEYPEGAARKKVLNFCANNYLGLSQPPRRRRRPRTRGSTRAATA